MHLRCDNVYQSVYLIDNAEPHERFSRYKGAGSRWNWRVDWCDKREFLETICCPYYWVQHSYDFGTIFVYLANPGGYWHLSLSLCRPLIRIIGDRFPWQVKSAILGTLGIMISKGGAALKPFLPQLQTTFIKCLQDNSRWRFYYL